MVRIFHRHNNFFEGVSFHLPCLCLRSHEDIDDDCDEDGDDGCGGDGDDEEDDDHEAERFHVHHSYRDN